MKLIPAYGKRQTLYKIVLEEGMKWQISIQNPAEETTVRELLIILKTKGLKTRDRLETSTEEVQGSWL